MSSPGQRRGKCGHVMANFDTHSHCARCRDKGKGKEPCVSDPQTSNCQIYNNLKSDQRQQLATPSYKLKKEKREAKLTEPAPSQDSEQLVDPSNVSVIGVIDAQGSVNLSSDLLLQSLLELASLLKSISRPVKQWPVNILLQLSFLVQASLLPSISRPVKLGLTWGR